MPISSAGDAFKCRSSNRSADVFTPWLRDTLRNQEVPGFPPAGERLRGADFTTLRLGGRAWLDAFFPIPQEQPSKLQNPCLHSLHCWHGMVACPLRAEVKQLFCWDVPASVGGRRQVAALEQFGRSPCYRASENIPMGGIVSVSKPEG